MCAVELATGATHIYEGERLRGLAAPPFPLDYTLIAFAADAELSCYEMLGWPIPQHIIDIRIEHMMLDRNVSTVEHLGVNLEQALAYYGILHACSGTKKEMQKLGGRGEPYTEEERAQLTEYCLEDVRAEAKLYASLLPKLDESCFYRGDYMCVAANIQNRGMAFDVDTYNRIKKHASALKLLWIKKYDSDFEIYTPQGAFNTKQFTACLEKRGLLADWPKTPKAKQPSVKDDVLRDLATAHAGQGDIPKLVELFSTVNLLKNFSLLVGEDGRHRTSSFKAFESKTSRNQPEGSVFGRSKWVRGLLKPAPGRAVAYLDWSSMEVGVGAWLSQDPELLKAYASGDAHMHLAKASGMVPQDATKDAKLNTYPPEQFEQIKHTRGQFKTCDLAAMYGCTAYALIKKGLSPAMAKKTLSFHHSVYSVFWTWVEVQIEKANDLCEAVTVGGWRVRIDSESEGYNSRSVGNFFVQANSAEIQRLAAIMAYKRGLGLCAVIHDAFLLEAPIEDMQRQVDLTKKCMDEASAAILDGFVLGVDRWKPEAWITYPNRYETDIKQVQVFWAEIMSEIEKLEATTDVVPCEV
jgi:DNA polymerase I-like protein with 3'-5' exonuclease and polymerase domains